MDTLTFADALTLEFFLPRYEDFPALKLAFEVGRAGGFKPAVFNAANEIAVYAFLDGKIRFADIYKTVVAVLDKMESEPTFTLEHLREIDLWARDTARALIK